MIIFWLVESAPKCRFWIWDSEAFFGALFKEPVHLSIRTLDSNSELESKSLWSMLRRPSAPQWISKWQNIFGTFQIECEKFWTFWKFLIFHDFSDFFRKFPKIFDFITIFMIFMIFHDFHDFFMKNQKFSKIQNFSEVKLRSDHVSVV